MSRSTISRLHAFVQAAAPALAAMLGAASPAMAQDRPHGFLFDEPRASLSIRAGWAGATAGSDLFAFTTRQLTLNRGDFASPTLSADFAWRLSSRTHVVASVGVSAMSTRSEFRDFTDNQSLPIEQTTTFIRLPMTIGLRQYLTPTGRNIGRFAWIPARVAPYVGAGAGFMYYRFRQSGDFIDFQTMDVFPSQLVSDGWTPTAHVLAGADYALGARFALTAEARYTWGRGELSNDFSGFQRLDLSGFATTAGLKIRY